MLGRVRPDLVSDTTGSIGEPGALLGELQGGPFGLGEYGRFAPGRDQVEPYRALPRLRRVLEVGVQTGPAAVDLAGPDLHQRPRRRRQRRLTHGSTGRDEVLQKLRGSRIAVVVDAGVHAELLVVDVVKHH